MSDRTLERDSIDAMVARVNPEWRVRDATLADSGFLPVYHLAVETPAGARRCVLKAAPGDGDPGVALEARVLRGIAERADVPVPDVLGAVDATDDLPAPYFLMEELPGESVPRREMDRLSPRQYEWVARQFGRHLADVHALDVFDAYGFLTVDADEPLAGQRPPTDFADVTVVDPADSWPRRAREWAAAALERLLETRFADLRADVAPVLQERVDALEGPFRPTLGHVDGAIENLLLGEDREVLALLDWAFTLAVPPAYDLVFVEHSLAGGHWSTVPSSPDVREAVRRGLVEGYQQVGDERAIERFRDHHDCYELLAQVNGMTVFEEWFEQRDVTDEQVAAAAENHRRTVRALL